MAQNGRPRKLYRNINGGDMLKKEVKKCMEEARNSSKHSWCLKKKVGAVLYDKSRSAIVGIGFGGGNQPCEKCERKTLDWQQDGCRSIHAEMRAMFHFFHVYSYSRNLSNMVMFTTHGPCDQCLKYMDYFGIRNVIYDIPYHNDYSKWPNINVRGINEIIL